MENEIYFENSLTFSGLGFGGLGCNPIITEQAKVLLKWCLDTVFENYQKKSHFQNFVPSGRCFSWNKIEMRHFGWFSNSVFLKVKQWVILKEFNGS